MPLRNLKISINEKYRRQKELHVSKTLKVVEEASTSKVDAIQDQTTNEIPITLLTKRKYVKRAKTKLDATQTSKTNQANNAFRNSLTLVDNLETSKWSFNDSPYGDSNMLEVDTQNLNNFEETEETAFGSLYTSKIELSRMNFPVGKVDFRKKINVYF